MRPSISLENNRSQVREVLQVLRPARGALFEPRDQIGRGHGLRRHHQHVAEVEADRVFFDPATMAQRTDVLKALIAGRPPGTTSDEWSTQSIAKQAPIQETAQVALETARERAGSDSMSSATEKASCRSCGPG